MTNRKFDIFYHLFAYKNFLTRKRRWILTVILQIAIPLFLFVGLWHFGDLESILDAKTEINNQKVIGQCNVHLFFVPQNQFTAELAEKVEQCLPDHIKRLDADAPEVSSCHNVHVEKNQFYSEEDMLRQYEQNHFESKEYMPRAYEQNRYRSNEYTSKDYERNRFDSKEYMPRGYDPNRIRPDEYMPRDYDPNRIRSNEYAPREYEPFNRNNQHNLPSIAFTAAIIFKNESAYRYRSNYNYTIKIPMSLPKEPYGNPSKNPIDLTYEKGYAAIQLCVEQEIIKMKKNDGNFRLQINLQEMERQAHVKPDIADEKLRRMFYAVIMLTFLIFLCVETSFVSNEKVSGINMLLSVHNTSYCLNLFAWLISGLLYSLLLTVPITVLSKYYYSDNLLPFLQYGNSFIFWTMLTLNVAHLITFGMHVSAYFNRAFFAVIAVFVLYVSSTVLLKYGIEENTFGVMPFFGIILPNIILLRTCEEFIYYEKLERTVKGLCWRDMFEVGERAYGLQGSVGMMLFFSILGIIFHFAMANYVYAINPGKYGIKKSPFSFIKFFKNLTKSNDYDKVENVECNGSNNKLFETVQKDCIPEIQVRKLTKTHRIGLLNGLKKCALRDLSIDFFEKQTTVLLGYSGSGKTSLLSILTGSTRPSDGLVLVNGKNVISQSDEVTDNLGFCPQEDVLFPHLSVTQHLRFYNMLKNPNKSRTLVGVEVRSLLEKLKLSNKKEVLPDKLSKAEKRKLCLGIALIGNPKILILDEPTLGLDAEEKRHVWNLLLKMNAQNTILIGTRDTEEANVLGDAVAMLHEGELKCYGSPNYLKKLLGHENLQVTLDTESQSELEKICEYFGPESEVIGINHEKIILSVPDNDELPNSLDKIELNKEELGITGINVSNFTLEKVYLEATYDNSAPLASREPSCSTVDKLDGEKQSGSVFKALLRKKATYTSNNISTIIIILTMFFVSLLCASLVLISESTRRKIEIPIKLDMYSNVTAAYHDNGRTARDYSENYRKIVHERYRDAVPSEYYNYNENRDASNYAYHRLVAAEFEASPYSKFELTATASYNSLRARYALPISINLVANAVLKTAIGSECSIDVSYGELPQFKDNVNVENLKSDARFDGYVVSAILVFFVCPAVSLFVVHPLRETLSSVKLLQRIAGVSAGAYWGVMFAFDLAILLVISVLFVAKFVLTDVMFSLQLFGWQEALIELLLFALFAVNALPFVYMFSFRKKSASSTIVLLSVLPIFLVAVDLSISIVKLYLCEDNEIFNIFRKIQKGVFLLVPYVSFFHGQVSLFNDMRINSECRKVTNLDNERVCELTPCCNRKRYDGSYRWDAVPYFRNFKDDIALETSVLAMGLTPILYFLILWILECKLIPKMLAKMSSGMPDNTDVAFEEQVKKVKHEIAFEASKVRENVSTEAINNGNLNTVENGTDTTLLVSHERKEYEFFVYELRIVLGSLAAIEDVSFGVQRNECFGLLGASGAGKTTILKTITGEKMPNHGMIYLRGERRHEGMAYCPQNNALIKSLNAYDHLRLFARLRGVPEKKIDREVTKWVDRLNLNDCASQPSETYSNGNKKRLNMAMALIGHPKLVLLDEPTRNLDPATKQSLWKIIQSCQIGQATILATNSMDECLTLCKSFAIMADGRFTDIGPSEELKQRLRTGYEVRFKLKYETTKDEINALKKEMSNVLPCGGLNENPGYLKFNVSPSERTWRQMYDLLLEIKDRFSCVEDFHVLTSSLEQFLSTRLQPINEDNHEKPAESKTQEIIP